MYAKIFAQMFDGSLRGMSDPILVFVNMLCRCDQDGIDDRHPKAIADETGLTKRRVDAALSQLSGTDADSRTPDEDGRRIVALDEHRAWGWRIVNHAKYRSIGSRDELRAYERDRKRSQRSQSPVSGTSPGQHKDNPACASASDSVSVSESAAEAEAKPRPEPYAADFEAVWALYPDKRGKHKARQAYQKARRDGALPDVIAEGLTRYRAYVEARHASGFDLKWQNGSTWFNQRGWEDEYAIEAEPKPYMGRE